MYLARKRIKGTMNYIIRETVERAGETLGSRDLLGLGPDPSQFVVYPGGRSFYIDERVSECFVEISPDDAAHHGFEDGAKVRVVSRRGDIVATVKVSPMAIPGTVFVPFHFAAAAANKLTNAALDPVSGIPEYKVCAVKLANAA